MAIFDRFKKGLSKSRKSITSRLNGAFKRHPKIDELFWENLEEVLIAGDAGFEAASQIVSSLKTQARAKYLSESQDIKLLLKDQIAQIIDIGKPQILKAEKQAIIVLGVNGTGKTTTIAKLAYKAKINSKKAILAAADTFRAAAIEQLEEWAKRVGVRIIKHERGSDPAAVVFDSLKAGAASDSDYVIADTAGRLHTQANLMDELKKIKRVAQTNAGQFKVKTLLILDANTGQNALVQTELFNQAFNIDEIALTKMDGTAKGGIIIAIAKKFQIPISFIGMGEKLDDLEEFDPQTFAYALLAD